jgi:uncharacterized integral membrane protein
MIPDDIWLISAILMILLSRFWISSQNESGCKLNYPEWSRSHFPLIRIMDLAILGATMGISNFSIQIPNLLKKRVQIRIERSNSEQVTWPSPGAPITISPIAGAPGQKMAFLCTDPRYPRKTGPGASRTIQNGGGWNFEPPGFRQCFVFFCPIRNGTVMRPSDLESAWKGAPADTQIICFGWDPICAKITPPPPPPFCEPSG